RHTGQASDWSSDVCPSDLGLAWLDANVDLDASLDYADMAMISMWQHALHYGFASTERHSRIAARVARFAERPSVASTTPERSLEIGRASCREGVVDVGRAA